MMSYWTNLNERERWLVGAGSICSVFYLFYLLVYSPLVTMTSQKSKLLQEKKDTLVWMQQVQQKPMNKVQKETISSNKLLSIIATELNERPFSNFPHELQQTGQGDIQLTFDTVPYTPFLTWLWTLANKYAISLKQFSAERTKTSGVVKIMLIIDTQSTTDIKRK